MKTPYTQRCARVRFIVTDGVFSMDGDIAPLPEIVALVYVDDAHSDGVLGATGAGITEHFGLKGQGRVALEMGTLSKALGSTGGFVASDHTVTDYLYQRARSFMFATVHLPPAIAAGLIAALDVVRAQPERLARLWSNAAYLREGLAHRGFNTGASVTPIIQAIVREAGRAMALGQALRALHRLRRTHARRPGRGARRLCDGGTGPGAELVAEWSIPSEAVQQAAINEQTRRARP